MDYTQEFRDIIINVSHLLGREVDMSKVEIIDRGMPHKPRSLKPGTMGVYTFNYKGRFLKIGKAGPNSNNRFLYQHYKPGSAMSTLAGSILPDPDGGLGYYREQRRRMDKEQLPSHRHLARC